MRQYNSTSYQKVQQQHRIVEAMRSRTQARTSLFVFSTECSFHEVLVAVLSKAAANIWLRATLASLAGQVFEQQQCTLPL